MHRDLTPQFTTARGTVEEWRDPERSYAASAHWQRLWYEHRVAGEARAKPETPDLVARIRQRKAELRARYPGVIIVEPSPEMPPVWEFDPLIQRVTVQWPDASLTETFRPQGTTLTPVGTTTVNTAYSISRPLVDMPSAFTGALPRQHRNRDDLDAYCYGPHPREALALLQPNCFLHGREADWDGRVETTVLGRPADLVTLRRLIPLTDPRILGDAFNPTVFAESEHAAVIIDRERQVILEWRGVWQREPYERHFFTDLVFDVPIDDATFDPAGRPTM